jgi:hypothetical protein
VKVSFHAVVGHLEGKDFQSLSIALLNIITTLTRAREGKENLGFDRSIFIYFSLSQDFSF